METDNLTPSNGLTLSYSTTIETPVLTGTAPNQWYEPAEPADGTFTDFLCVKDVPNVGNLTAEMTEHRCLNRKEKFVAKYPNGFLTSEATQIRVSFDRTEHATLLGYQKAGTQLSIRLKLAARPDETTPSKILRTGYISQLSDTISNGGDEVESTLSFEWSSVPKITEGS